MLENTDVYQPDIFTTVEHDGKTIMLYSDLEKIKKHLLEISPDDSAEIEKLVNSIERFFSFQVPHGKPFDQMSISDKIKLGMSMKDVGPVMKELGKITLVEYVERFRHPDIKDRYPSDLRQPKNKVSNDGIAIVITEMPLF